MIVMKIGKLPRFSAIIIIILISCGKNIVQNSDDHQLVDSTWIGTDSTLDIMTWNLENFPLNGSNTIDKVSETIEILDLDIIVFQEIEDAESFTTLKNSTNGWDGYRANSASYNINLAFFYKINTIILNDIYEIYTDDWWAFPRSPLVCECTFQNVQYVVINNHLKAGGGNDDEDRRLNACIKLKEYIQNNFSENNLILLGDLNDLLTDEEDENVFWGFISEPSTYQFVDMEIAEGSSYYWSYPLWPSHLDHILITNELFGNWNVSKVFTLRLDDYINNYFNNISDHRPVLIKFTIDKKERSKSILLSF